MRLQVWWSTSATASWRTAKDRRSPIRGSLPKPQMLSPQSGLSERSMRRLMSRAAAALLAFGASGANAFLRWRDYRRTLEELESLSDRDLQDLRISEADFDVIARDEAERCHRLRRRISF